MQLFFTTQIEEGLAYLPEEEARHCFQVLRYREGQQLSFTDGQGHFYEGKIVEASKKNCVIGIKKKTAVPKSWNFNLHIAIAPTKNIARIEWFIEKATEIGIDQISLILTEHSERRKVRADRLEKRILAAMKQSLKAHKPSLSPELIPFREFIDTTKASQQLIAYLGQGVKGSIRENYSPPESVCIMVGPEGGFSAAEAEAARQKGFRAVHLGKSRLRTETAGLVACHTIHLLNE
jgi:16S rRNA (uracil1498-N3)-methyltransferase